MVIKASRRHRLAHRKQHAVMSGAHLVLEVVQALEYILWTRVQRNALCQCKRNWPHGVASSFRRHICVSAARSRAVGTGGAAPRTSRRTLWQLRPVLRVQKVATLTVPFRRLQRATRLCILEIAFLPLLHTLSAILETGNWEFAFLSHLPHHWAQPLFWKRETVFLGNSPTLELLIR